MYPTINKPINCQTEGLATVRITLVVEIPADFAVAIQRRGFPGPLHSAQATAGLETRAPKRTLSFKGDAHPVS